MKFRRHAAVILGTAAFAISGGTVGAADFGGDCCADLEERVAELESTVARKGNRVVSLKVYGQVNTGIMFWDNGEEDNVYIVDNDNTSTRAGFMGKAAINAEWSAGYRLELEFQSAASNNMTEFSDEADVVGGIRQAFWFLESKRLGRISVGQQDTVNSGAAEIDLSGADVIALSGHNAFIADIAIGNSGGVNWDGYVFGNLEFNRQNVVKYTSPVIAGFSLGASMGEDDLWDIGFRYAGTLGDFKLAGAMTYGELTDFAVTPRTDHVVIGSGSVVHAPTGLFVTAGASSRDSRLQVPAAAQQKRGLYMWHVQSGVVRRWLTAGATTLYGEYASFNGDTFGSLGEDTADVYGGGFVQKIDAAAMELYLGYRHYAVETDDIADPDDADSVMAGARVKF